MYCLYELFGGIRAGNSSQDTLLLIKRDSPDESHGNYSHQLDLNGNLKVNQIDVCLVSLFVFSILDIKL